MERISLESGIATLETHCKIQLSDEKIDLMSALGRVLSEDVVAKHHQPPFDRSPLDGYAVRGEDTSHASKDHPVQLEVIEEVYAGHLAIKELKPGQAIRIMTGGPMPKGSNGVIKQEDTDEGMEQVSIYKGIKPFQNYCYAGEDYSAGDVLIEAGEYLTAYHIGLLASNGVTQVSVKKKLKVGLMSTGDELIEPDQPLSEGKIYNSNLYTLAARLVELGCEPIVIATVHDDIGKTVELIKNYKDQVDIIITTGGVSVGKMDIMHPVYEELGVNRLFWRLQLKPGTPVLAGQYDDLLLLSLSGNPSAAAITFELLFRPLLSKVTKCQALNTKRTTGIMKAVFKKKSPNRRFVKAMATGGEVMITRGNQSSGVLKSMIGCNCFIDIPSGSEALEIGEKVEIVLI